VSVSLAFILLVGIVSGIMPSWHISRFQPIDIVKGNFRYHSKMVMGRLFIIIQNIVTVTMLTAALVIWLQVNHLIHAPLGFNTKHLYYIMSPEGKSQTVRNQLERLPFVETIGEMRGTTFSDYNSRMRPIKKGEKLVTLFITDLDSTAFKLYDLEVLKDYGPTDGGYYLNEDAIRRLEYTDKVREMDWGNGKIVPISGILKDFHRINVLDGAEPFAIRVKEHVEDPNFLVKTNGDKQAKAAFINILKALDVPDADQPENVSSLEENIAESFADQHNTLKIITLFTIIAVIISVMGYVGMSLFFIRQRQKEIGIRKIMGSTSVEVMILMLRIFCAPLLISFIIAIPLSWYIMRDWLSNFSYRIELSAWIFVATCAIALLVAILSVSLQIIKAVRTNPVESIKTE
jgi:putative ABC transport system permease protein